LTTPIIDLLRICRPIQRLHRLRVCNSKVWHISVFFILNPASSPDFAKKAKINLTKQQRNCLENGLQRGLLYRGISAGRKKDVIVHESAEHTKKHAYFTTAVRD